MVFVLLGRRTGIRRVVGLFVLLHCWLPCLRPESVQAANKMLLLSPVRAVFTERERALELYSSLVFRNCS